MKITIKKDGVVYRENASLKTLIDELRYKIAQKDSIYDIRLYDDELKYTRVDYETSTLSAFSVELPIETDENSYVLQTFREEIYELVKMHESVAEETTTKIERRTGILTHIENEIMKFKETNEIPILSQNDAQREAEYILNDGKRIVDSLCERDAIVNLESKIFGFLGISSLISTIVITVIAAFAMGPAGFVALIPGLAITKPLLMTSESIKKENVNKLVKIFLNSIMKKYNLGRIGNSIKQLTADEIEIRNHITSILLNYKITKRVDTTYDIEAVKYLLNLLATDKELLIAKLKQTFKSKLFNLICGTSLAVASLSIALSIILNPLFSIALMLIFVAPLAYREINYSNLNKLIESFHDEILVTYGLKCDEKTKKAEISKTPKEEKQISDKFLKYIKSDLDYISHHKDEGEYGDLIQKLSVLSIEYANALNTEMLGGSSVDRYAYLKKLTDLEVEMYSRNTTVGLTAKNKVHLSETILQERLQCMGITCEQSLNDKWLEEVNATIKRVLATPYEGCEEEIAKLLRIAQEYAKKEMSTEDQVGSNNQADLMTRLVEVEMTIGTKLARAQKSSSLKEDLAIIQSAISAGPMSEEVTQYQTSGSQSTVSAFRIQKK